MIDWRRIERELVDHFRRSGLEIKDHGDKFAVSDTVCQMAAVGNGRCAGAGRISINLTAIARDIEGVR